MLHFRSREDAERAEIPEDVRHLVLARIGDFEKALARVGCEWVPEDDGHFSLITAEEAALPLAGMGWETRLAELLFESVYFHDGPGLWEVVYIPGNNWGWTVFVPDSPVLPEDLVHALLREVTPEEAQLARRARS